MKSPCRIAIVSDSVFPFNRGGKETRIHELTLGLVQSGFTVHVYTMRWWDGPRTITLEGITFIAISPNYPMYAGSRRSITQGVMFGLACLSMVRYRYDLIEADHMPFFPLYTLRLAAWLRRKPLYATWHEVWGQTYWRKYLGFPGVLAYVVELLSARMPDHIVAVSPLTAERLRTVLKTATPVQVINNGVDISNIADAVDSAAIKSDVIFVGRLLAHKNVDVLIKAIHLLQASRPDIRCLIVGDGPEQDRLGDLSRELGVQERIQFAGPVASNETVYASMRMAGVCVLPSSREGFGIVAIEAMACGTPVITVDEPDNATRMLITPQTGRVVALSPRAIADEITQMLDLGTVVERQAVASYTWSSVIEQTTALYRAATER